MHHIKTRGFTIVELLIVIVTIAILVGIVIVAYNGVQTKAKIAKIEADLNNVQKLVETYKTFNGTYPITNASLNPDWGTSTGRTDANCSVGTKTSDWVPGLDTSLPQSGGQGKGIGGYPGCYIYVSDGTSYVISAWNMLSSPQNSVMYRRLGLREMDASHTSSIFYVCNHPNVGGMATGSYDITTDYYKRSMTISNITSALCSETPPTGA
jgi:type II secretory pathway pseudopilin PulG